MTKLLPAYRPKKLRPRVDHERDDFRREIWQKGMWAQWEMAHPCPCRTKLTVGAGDTAKVVESGEPRSDCPACLGTGSIYHSAQRIPVLPQSIKKDAEYFSVYGSHVARHMASVTTLPEHALGLEDRLTMEQQTTRYKEPKVRGSGTVDKLRHPILTRTVAIASGDDEAGLTTPTTTDVGVIHCVKQGAAGLPEATEIVQNTHFTVNSDGYIDWSIGDAAHPTVVPSQGQLYTVSYFGPLVLVVLNIPRAPRDTFLFDTPIGVPGAAPQEVFRHGPVLADCVLDFYGRKES